MFEMIKDFVLHAGTSAIILATAYFLFRMIGSIC